MARMPRGDQAVAKEQQKKKEKKIINSQNESHSVAALEQRCVFDVVAISPPQLKKQNFLVLSSERWVNEERRWKTSAPPV